MSFVTWCNLVSMYEIPVRCSRSFQVFLPSFFLYFCLFVCLLFLLTCLLSLLLCSRHPFLLPSFILSFHSPFISLSLSYVLLFVLLSSHLFFPSSLQYSFPSALRFIILFSGVGESKQNLPHLARFIYLSIYLLYFSLVKRGGEL